MTSWEEANWLFEQDRLHRQRQEREVREQRARREHGKREADKILAVLQERLHEFVVHLAKHGHVQFRPSGYAIRPCFMTSPWTRHSSETSEWEVVYSEGNKYGTDHALHLRLKADKNKVRWSVIREECDDYSNVSQVHIAHGDALSRSGRLDAPVWGRLGGGSYQGSQMDSRQYAEERLAYLMPRVMQMCMAYVVHFNLPRSL